MVYTRHLKCCAKSMRVRVPPRPPALFFMPPVPEHPSLSDMQQWVADMCKERGFDKNSVLEKFFCLPKKWANLPGLFAKFRVCILKGKVIKKVMIFIFCVKNLPMSHSIFLILLIRIPLILNPRFAKKKNKIKRGLGNKTVSVCC